MHIYSQVIFKRLTVECNKPLSKLEACMRRKEGLSSSLITQVVRMSIGIQALGVNDFQIAA